MVLENFQAVTKKVKEDCRHTSLKGREGVAQSEWHESEGEWAKRTCERRLIMIIGINVNLIVARISVTKVEIS